MRTLDCGGQMRTFTCGDFGRRGVARMRTIIFGDVQWGAAAAAARMRTLDCGDLGRQWWHECGRLILASGENCDGGTVARGRWRFVVFGAIAAGQLKLQIAGRGSALLAVSSAVTQGGWQVAAREGSWN